MTIHESSKNWKNYVKKAAVEVDAKFPRNDWTSTYPGHGEHSAVGAYAVDFMIGDKEEGDKIANYVWANRVRLNVWYVIWNRRIISRTPGRGTWRPYFNGQSSNPSKAHTNHVHVSFYVSSKDTYTAPVTPSKPPVSPVQPSPVQTPTPTYPKPSDRIVYVSKLKSGQQDSDSVYWVQKALGVTTDGDYGPETEKAASAFQKSLGDDVDGELGIMQTVRLFAAHQDLNVTVLEKP